jgi:NAD(P)-dependent dehydrogenase (short-subunit alcohol dehydrogenase family)
MVTGGTRGIGLAITRALLVRGARVLICARKQAELDQTVTTLRADFGDSVSGACCDVGNHDSVRELFNRLRRDFEGLDILINNAGVGYFGNVERMSVEEWNATIATNLSGVFYCCREAVPMMKARGGYIVNIGSLAGKHASPGSAAYCASKFGLLGFSEALMQEVRYDHIRVSCVMPGSVNTGFGRGGAADPRETWKLLPEDVARVVINLFEIDRRALPSVVELRPSEPRK